MYLLRFSKNQYLEDFCDHSWLCTEWWKLWIPNIWPSQLQPSWPSRFRSRRVNRCPFLVDLVPWFFACLCFLLWPHCLKRPPSVVLRRWLVFLSASRLRCPLGESRCVEAQVHAWVTGLLAEGSVLSQQHIKQGVFKQKHTYTFVYWSVDENLVARGSQEHALLFALGAMVLDSLV